MYINFCISFVKERKPTIGIKKITNANLNFTGSGLVKYRPLLNHKKVGSGFDSRWEFQQICSQDKVLE
jgi:hypothetical protein